MIKVWEVVAIQKQAIEDGIEEEIRNSASKGCSSCTVDKVLVPWWLQEELKEAGFTLIDKDTNDCQLIISWKTEV